MKTNLEIAIDTLRHLAEHSLDDAARVEAAKALFDRGIGFDPAIGSTKEAETDADDSA